MSKRIALITGSTSGIGLAIAQTLAKNGCDILLNGFGTLEDIRKIINEIQDTHKVCVHYSPADMAKPSEITAMVEECEKIFGGLDILVNNAGIQHVAPVSDFPPEKWDQIIAVNLSSNFHTIRAAVPIMRERGFGRIVNIASVHGLVGSVQKSAYVAAKHGVLGLTKVVALETVETPITCNAVCPGWVRTPLVEQQIVARARENKLDLHEAKAELLGEKQPSKQFVSAEQIGETVAYLCSDAASEMRGASITVDGGWLAQ